MQIQRLRTPTDTARLASADALLELGDDLFRGQAIHLNEILR
jgi:hypothetical protein